MRSRNVPDNFLRQIVADASTIDERLAGNYVTRPGHESRQKAERNLRDWVEMSCNGDKALFDSMLLEEGIDLVDVSRILGDVDLKESALLPTWAHHLANSCDAIADDDCERHEIADPSNPFPFEDLFIPAVCAAHARLTSENQALFGHLTHLISKQFLIDLQRELLSRICHLAETSVYRTFYAFRHSSHLYAIRPDNLSGNAYQAFCAYMRSGGLPAHLRLYPVLARAIGTVVEEWLNCSSVFLGRFLDDHDEIFSTLFQSVCSRTSGIEHSLGDRHNGGRSVLAIVFENNTRVIYKPRSVTLEGVWYKFVNNLSRIGFPETAFPARVIERAGYGWMEYIAPRQCTSRIKLNQFYFRTGSTICLLHLLQGTDIHHENVVARAESPVLLDLETLASPWLSDEDEAGAAAHRIARDLLRESVLSTGYLPRWSLSPAGIPLGMGGLSAPYGCYVDYFRLEKINTDRMSMRRHTKDVSHEGNLPMSGDGLLPANFSECVLSGFREMYNALQRHRDDESLHRALADFANRSTRQVLRPTQLYALILKRSLEPEYLISGVAWSLHFYLLWRLCDRRSSWIGAKDVRRIEREQLARLDVPFFLSETNSRDLFDVDQRLVQNFCREKSYSQIIARLRELNEAALQRQIEIISGSLDIDAFSRRFLSGAALSMPSRYTDAGPFVSDTLMTAAKVIGDKLLRLGIFESGDCAWIGVVPVGSSGVVAQFDVIGDDLYSGSCGIALFLATLASHERQAIHENAALACLTRLRADIRGCEGPSSVIRRMGLGAGVGVGGVLYAISQIALLLQSGDLLDDGLRLASAITADQIRRDHTIDIIGGSAGCILGLLKAHSLSGNDLFLERAINCGTHVAAEVDKWAVEKPPSRGPLSIAHGVLGVIFSLVRLFERTRIDAFLLKARFLLEQHVLEETVNSLAGFQRNGSKEDRLSSHWCRGSAGSSIAAAAAMLALSNADVSVFGSRMIAAAVSSEIVDFDHLCCGESGRLDSLLTVGQMLNDDKLVSLVRNRLSHIADKATEKNLRFPSAVANYNPGLFNGIAGVGYAFLRAAHPTAIPSVLAWT